MLNPDLHLMNNSELIYLKVGLNPIYKFAIRYRFGQVLILDLFVLDGDFDQYLINNLIFFQLKFF